MLRTKMRSTFYCACANLNLQRTFSETAVTEASMGRPLRLLRDGTFLPICIPKAQPWGLWSSEFPASSNGKRLAVGTWFTVILNIDRYVDNNYLPIIIIINDRIIVLSYPVYPSFMMTHLKDLFPPTGFFRERIPSPAKPPSTRGRKKAEALRLE